MITISRIQIEVSADFGISVALMLSKRRALDVVNPRHVAIWLAKELTTHSLMVIAREFGDLDHTTVMNAVARISRLDKTDADLSTRVTRLLAKLRAMGEEKHGLDLRVWPKENVDILRRDAAAGITLRDCIAKRGFKDAVARKHAKLNEIVFRQDEPPPARLPRHRQEALAQSQARGVLRREIEAAKAEMDTAPPYRGGPWD